MNRPKVAIDARLISGTSTGDSSYWTGLLHGLASSDQEFDYLLFTNAARPPQIPIGPRFQWITLPASSSRWWSLVQFPLRARKLGARAIHTQYSLSPLVGNQGITTIHDVSFFIGPEWFRPRDRFLLQQTVPAAAKRAAKIIAVSNQDKAEIERYIPQSTGKIRVIYNGLPPWIVRDPDPGPRLAKLGATQPYLLTVGTRWPRKNMKLAIEAAAALGGPKLVVTGKPGWGEDAPNAIVQATGYVDAEDLCALYSGASLYLAPSFHEGFGIPIIEAFACGCPVICSTGGAMPEVAGDAAIVEPTWEPEHWANSIRAALGDSGKLDALRQRGFQRVQKFDWRQLARETNEVYREVVG